MSLDEPVIPWSDELAYCIAANKAIGGAKTPDLHTGPNLMNIAVDLYCYRALALS